MADFLWREVSEKEKEKIRKEARKIIDSFSKKLSKVSEELGEPLIERDEFERTESKNKKTDKSFSRELFFGNAPKKNKDFILGEKKKW